MKVTRKDMTQDILNELLLYDPVTGVLIWKERSGEWFNHCKYVVRQTNMWNAKFANKEAFRYRDPKGYKTGAICDVSYQAHRVIWCMMTGEWPEEVDHINGITDDNRWINLRSVCHSTNGRNAKRRYDNTSGVTGVNWQKSTQKWVARIQVDEGVTKHLGRYNDLDEAVEARKEAEKEYGYHSNHGR